MAETMMVPDFEQIAEQMADRLYETVDGCTRPRTTGESIIMTRAWYVDQLRAAWNARGAADLALIDQTLSMLMGSTAAAPYVKHLGRSLKALDR